MRRFNDCVFDDIVYGTVTVYTGAQYSELLGLADQRTIQLIGFDAGSGNTHVTVRIEQSLDGIRWAAKNAVPEINQKPIPAGTTVSYTGADAGLIAGDGLARLAISLTDPGGTGGPPSAALRVYVTGRDAGKWPAQECPCSPELDADDLPEHLATHELLRQAVLNIVTSSGPLLPVQALLRLEWLAALLDDVPEEERGLVLLDELEESEREVVLDAVHRIRAEIEGTRLSLVRGERRPSAPIGPRALRWQFMEDLGGSGPEFLPEDALLFLQRAHLESVDGAATEWELPLGVPGPDEATEEAPREDSGPTPGGAGD